MMDYYAKTKLSYEQTKDVRDLLNLRVLSVSGEELGKVSKIRLHPINNELEGIVCMRAFFSGSSNRSYFCKEYIARITDDAILLNIEPAFVWVGHNVVSLDGKVLGRVNKVIRVGDSAEIESIMFKRFFLIKVSVPIKLIKNFGTSIVLKKTYAEVNAHGFK